MKRTDMVFGWKKNTAKSLTQEGAELHFFQSPALTEESIAVAFSQVNLPPCIQDMNLQIPSAAWLILAGEDDFAKALFCDLCFSYILPETGKVSPVLRGGDVSFLGRSNTTYGNSLLDHLTCGVKETSKESVFYITQNVLSKRFLRHLSKQNPLIFADNRKAPQVELDERDFLEIAEGNLLLQKRKAAVIDTTSDFYQIALEQGFRHSQEFLQSGKILLWILNETQALPKDARPWEENQREGIKKIHLSFPRESLEGYLN